MKDEKGTAKARRSKRRESRSIALPRLITDKRMHLALGITMIVAAIVCIACIISYLKSGAIDYSVAAGHTITEIQQSGEAVANVGGPFGARLAHWLMVDTLGAASIISVIWLGVVGLCLVGAMKCRFWSFTFKCLFTAVALSVILGFITYNLPSKINWGGNHGHYINAWLKDVGGPWLLCSAVSLVLIGILVAIYYYPLQSLLRRLRSTGSKISQHTSMQKSQAENTESEQTDSHKAETNRVVVFDENDTKTVPDAIAHTPVAPAPQPAESENNNVEAVGGMVIHTPKIEEAENVSGESLRPLVGDKLYDHRAELSRFQLPTAELLIDRPEGKKMDADELNENKELIVKTLLDYKIPIAKIEATVGPTVTLYEIVPAEGVRIAQIKRLEDDIALSLAALGIRIIAPIPGKGTVGIEVPNKTPNTVSIRKVLTSKKFNECDMLLPMAMGATISNDIYIADLTKMPHLLVAGATGQGKSVGLNTIIASLLYKKHPSELKFVLIDPKMVEFSLYGRLERHYLAKLPDEESAIVTDPNKALATLQSLCVEMDQRYDLLRKAQVRSLEEYNKKFVQRGLNPENGHRYMPYIVMIVDEFADLIMTAGRDISTYIARIAQKARAVGMHMIIATQRPSTDVITGMIKANFPSRIAFRVSQRVDSMTILDRTGADRLIGKGDMLFSYNGKIERVQGAYIDTKEVDAIAAFIDNQIGFPSAYILPDPLPAANAAGGSGGGSDQRDERFNECARFVVQNATASTSALQRRFSIGYNKAGKIMDQMEAAGIVGPADGSKPRAVLVDAATLERILEN